MLMYGLRKGCYQGRRAFCRGVFGKEGDNGDEGGTFIKGGLMFYLIVYYNDFWLCMCGSDIYIRSEMERKEC